MRRLLAFAATALVLAACGTGNEDAGPTTTSTTTTTSAAASSGSGTGTGTVAVRTFQFRPSPVEVSAGTTVRWANEDDIEHTVTAGTPDAPNPEFDGVLAGKGARFETSFAQPGTYRYFCRRHPSMTGQVVVS